MREFGRLEARVEAWAQANATKSEPVVEATTPVASKNGSAASKAAPVVPVPAVTKAPDPITPVGSSEAATTVPLDQMSYKDFKAVRNRQERERLGLQ